MTKMIMENLKAQMEMYKKQFKEAQEKLWVETKRLENEGTKYKDLILIIESIESTNESIIYISNEIYAISLKMYEARSGK